jgi:osmoprotectant transport system substrate-binding protein
VEGDGLLVLAAAAAENTNGLAVSRRTAQRLELRTTSDLVPHATGMTLAAPPECATRPYCLPGLERVYGLRFGEVTAYDAESQRLTAVGEGLADVAVVFTTDGRLAAGDFVVLDDDRDLQPAENVVPVVSARAVDRHGRRVVEVLERVVRELDTEALAFLNWRVEVAGNDVPAEAAGWLHRHGLTS